MALPTNVNLLVLRKSYVNIIDTFYKTGRKVAIDFKQTMRISFDDFLSREN